MLIGFDSITYELTDYERKTIVPVLVEKLKTCKGVAQAATNGQLMTHLTQRGLPGISEARIRKLINYVRNQHLINALIATSKGYFVASCPEEVLRYIESLEGRGAAIHALTAAMKQDYQRMLQPQQTSLNL